MSNTVELDKVKNKIKTKDTVHSFLSYPGDNNGKV